jgi:predicted Zn-dependent protease
MYRSAYTTRRRGGLPLGRLLIAGLIVIVSLISYFGNSQDNPVTGETQHIDLTVEQEIALGLQAAPEMAQQFGGLDDNQSLQAQVDAIGQQIVENSAAGRSPYEFDFHVLEDPETINAFALPGGQIFVTNGLLSRMTTEGQVAGVLGHEVGHVIGRHSAEQIAKARLTEGLTGAAVIAAYDPNNPTSAGAAQMAVLVGQLVNLRFGRQDELESDFLGVCFLAESGYNPNELVQVMDVLASARQGAEPPEFFSTHPNPESRVERIQQAIQNLDQCP